MLRSEFFAARRRNSHQLMIMLHGLGDSIEGYRWFPEAINLPWLNVLLVNAPDKYYGGYSWYDYEGDMEPGVVRSRGELFELLDSHRAKGWPSEKVILGGFSQGSLISIDTGLRYEDRLGGIVGISGYVWEPERLITELAPVARQQRLLVTHGTFDPVIPIERTRPQIELLKGAGLNIEWHEFEKPHIVAGELELSLIRGFVVRCVGSS